jgi:NitT/TauT family transport system permease protein
MMSVSGGWFFVVFSETITVGNSSIALPGIGSYIALASERRDLKAIGWAILTMLIVILIYDQLMFRPLVAWVDRLRFEQDPSAQTPHSWALTLMQRSKLVSAVTDAFYAGVRWTSWTMPIGERRPGAAVRRSNWRTDIAWYGCVVILIAVGLWHIISELIAGTTLHEVASVCGLAVLTMIRVLVLIVLASAIWLPIGVWVGLRPQLAAIVQPVAQFLAAFPNNLLFPLAVYVILTWRLNPDIWLSPLMILGTQWYILFNVIAGATAIPGELRYAAENFRLRGWIWWRTMAIPAVFPYFVTGAITASGGAWNAAIAAELVKWGTYKVRAHGLGAYLADASDAADFHRMILGTVTMSLFIVTINRSLWRPLYYYGERRFRLA